jgi:hypothetical protein
MKSREPRRKVLVRTRIRSGAAWYDASILNISSRGMLLQAADPPVRGSYLELRRGALVIVAKVMWRESRRFGVKTQDELPIQAIVDNVAVQELGEGVRLGDRRRQERLRLPADQRSRQQGRIIEYGFAMALSVALSIFAAAQVYSMLASPLAAVGDALTGGTAPSP